MEANGSQSDDILGRHAGQLQFYSPQSSSMEAKGSFCPSTVLIHYPDHAQDGIFETDPTLAKFLSTHAASVAGIHLQHAFEAEHSQDDCYAIIENYANGGDNYLTEDVMRRACSPPLRQRQAEGAEGIAAVLVGDASSQQEQDSKTAPWEHMRSS